MIDRRRKNLVMMRKLDEEQKQMELNFFGRGGSNSSEKKKSADSFTSSPPTTSDSLANAMLLGQGNCSYSSFYSSSPSCVFVEELLDALRPATTTLDTLEGSQLMCPVLFLKGIVGSFWERLQCPDPAEVMPFLS